MFVVPIAGDKVKTKDSSDPAEVSSFTSLKNEPAVYVIPTTSTERYIYFSDIVEINGVRVEYDPTSKLFNSLGPLKRRFNLPQPKDTIIVKLQDVSYKDETENVVIKSLKLHNKKEGITRGLLCCGEESCFSLSEIIKIERAPWTENFTQHGFQKYYRDYLPFALKSKG